MASRIPEPDFEEDEQPTRGAPPGQPYRSVRERIREHNSKKQAERQALAAYDAARLRPLGLQLIASPGMAAPRHLRILDRALVDAASGRIPRLLVEMPPRHGKSTLVSQHFPAWYLATFPDRRLILASYEAAFAASWGRQARELFGSWGPRIWNQSVSDSAASSEWWWIRGHSGYMATAGVGGPLTGKGASLIVIDDPVKNAEEARSPLQRARAWDWYRSVLRTRLEPGGGIVLVMSRWHEDDLAGRLLAEAKAGGEAWTELRLPALAEQDDPLGRLPDTALWPDRFDAPELKATRRTIGPHWWNALYQGRPTADSGGAFNRSGERRYTYDGEAFLLRQSDGSVERVPDTGFQRVACCDLNISLNTQSDFTAVITGAFLPLGRIIILDILRKHFGPGQHTGPIKEIVERWECGYVGVEDNAFQGEVIEKLRRAGVAVKPLRAQGDKLTRSDTAAAMWNAGDIYLPANAAWAEDLIEELAVFPLGRHDDQVDALSYLARESQAGRKLRIVSPLGIPKRSVWR